mmetsp:Transcript_28017/g.59751  ORF Transcript_28017/g.59751 Transcript_28017/m.59751 type:complete len:219 (-) Transcript_28017:301-957(-)
MVTFAITISSRMILLLPNPLLNSLIFTVFFPVSMPMPMPMWTTVLFITVFRFLPPLRLSMLMVFPFMMRFSGWLVFFIVFVCISSHRLSEPLLERIQRGFTPFRKSGLLFPFIFNTLLGFIVDFFLGHTRSLSLSPHRCHPASGRRLWYVVPLGIPIVIMTIILRCITFQIPPTTSPPRRGRFYQLCKLRTAATLPDVIFSSLRNCVDAVSPIVRRAH